MYIDGKNYRIVNIKFDLDHIEQNYAIADATLEDEETKKTICLSTAEEEVKQLFKGLFTIQFSESIRTKRDMIASLLSDKEILAVAKDIIEEQLEKQQTILDTNKSKVKEIFEIA